MASNDRAAAPQPRWVRWLTGLTGVAAVIIAGAKLIDTLTLPPCDSDRIVTTVKDIFKEKAVPLDEVGEIQHVSDEVEAKNCRARVRGGGETADITFQILWDGWDKTVKIGDVKVVAVAGGAQTR